MIIFKPQIKKFYGKILTIERGLAPGSERKQGFSHYLPLICDNSKYFPDWETLD